MQSSPIMEGGIGFRNIKTEEFIPLIQAAISNYRTVIAAVKSLSSFSWQNSIQPLEEAAEKLDRIWNLLQYLHAVNNTPQIRTIYENILPEVTNFHTDLLQDLQLCNIYTQVVQSSEYSNLSKAQQAVLNHALRDFKLTGVDLSQPQRVQVKRLSEQLQELEIKFENNLLDATQAWDYHVAQDQQEILAGLPNHTLETAKTKAQQQGKSGWVLTLDRPCMDAVLSYAHNRNLRREYYTAYTTRASEMDPDARAWDNTPIIAQIIKFRQELAMLLGFNNFADYAFSSRMAPNPQHVEEFLYNLLQQVKPKAEHEFALLAEFAQEHGLNDAMQAWDVAYYGQMAKLEKYAISEEELRSYFPEPRVLAGMFKLVWHIFGIEIEEITEFAAWHPTVRCFKVTDRDQVLRGYFYLDLYTREGKFSGAWMEECVSRLRFANGELQAPVAFLTCNFAPPTTGHPGLLTHEDVVTLFHEFGHTLHHVLTKVDQFSVSGMYGVDWDAVELPSQFMENWCWQWDVIQDISENIHSGEQLSRDTFDRLIACKNYNSAMFLLRQIEMALFDLRIHRNLSIDTGKSVHEVLQAVRNEVAVYAVPESNRFETSFAHIFADEYAAGYYSYLWAEVLSCDAFEKFIANDLYDATAGNAFLTHILEQGGSQPPIDLFVAFMGREPKVDALLRNYAIM